MCSGTILKNAMRSCFIFKNSHCEHRVFLYVLRSHYTFFKTQHESIALIKMQCERIVLCKLQSVPIVFFKMQCQKRNVKAFHFSKC